MQVAIETERLSKVYGKRPVVHEMSFTVNPGEVYALVGPNGAGKTTVIRLVTGLAFPSSGSVRLLGADPQKNPNVKRKLGAVVEAPAAFYPYYSGRANLKLHAALAGGVSENRIKEVLEMMQLTGAADKKVGVYSLGMRQRLGVAAALLTRPDILILDEPASGMDPLSLHLVHGVLRQAAKDGTAVLLSTHHLDEVVAYCSRVAIMEEGRLIDEVNLLDRRDRYRIRVSDVIKAKRALEAQPFVRHISSRADELIFILSDAKYLPAVAPVLLAEDIQLLEMVRDTFDLRSYYRERLQEQRARPRADAGGAERIQEPVAVGGQTGKGGRR